MFKFFKKKEEKLPQFILMNCVKSCGKEKCPIWVINYSKGPEDKPIEDGRCGFHWMPVLMIEIRQSIDRLTQSIQTKGKENGKSNN